ncbi:hypothetical protein FKW77_001837 [Venturia effusa]|uniref:Uncharacterized protein n=1 Tax=Venturia effusa TaxID=50376 RepID=A0A517LNG1_9PEZI|nr:hypothetical protein FKW77_001837 [Venturia effusa]
MASWKIFETPVETEVVLTSFNNATKFFAIDASGSTGGTPMLAQRNFAVNLHSASTHEAKDHVAKWGSSADNPRDILDVPTRYWNSDLGGTQPTRILKNEACLSCIWSSDVFFLLTDGEVWDTEVQDLARLGQEKGIFSCPTVFLITSHLAKPPDRTDVSVGVTSFANAKDALCLLKDYLGARIYVIAAKGVFQSMDNAKDRGTWEGLTSFDNEAQLLAKIQELDIRISTAETRGTLPSGVDLGLEWNQAHNATVLVDPEKLLQASSVNEFDLRLLLHDEAIDVLTLAYKTRGKLPQFRRFLQDNKIEQVTIQLEDVAGAAAIIAELGDPDLTSEVKAHLQEKLRAAHVTNREKYLDALKNDQAGSAARDRNRLIDSAMRQLAEIEKAGYTADILSRTSNRARRAETTVSADASIALSILDLEAPSYKAECPICCGEDEIMSVVLKQMDGEATGANTADFALDFPLAAGRFSANMNVVSSQCICFQCALFGRPGLSIYAEPIAAVLPALEYSGTNQQYINQQLYLALNGGLKTGVPALAQLFATILDRTLQTKAWAGASDPTVGPRRAEAEDAETTRRKNILDWILQTVLRNLRCRETFSELGEWGDYPTALAWAARDFENEGLTSWACQYPVAGFNQLIRFGTMTGVFSEDLIRRMKKTKLIHSLVSTYLAKLRDNPHERAWTHTFLEMIYAEFNSGLVPRDLGSERTILSSVETFWAKLQKVLTADPTLLEGWQEADKASLMFRLQTVLFWLIYFQRTHTLAKTWFANIKTSEPLAAAVLEPTAELSASVVKEILLSPFVENDKFINKRLYILHQPDVIPFANPFGCSVLKCGHPGCNASFMPAEMVDKTSDAIWTSKALDQVRQARAKHLIQVFGIATRFETNQTGLPEPTTLPVSPSSLHTPLHISFARAWSELSVQDRRAAINGSVEHHVAAVIKKICESGRGNVFDDQLEVQIKELYPSFFEVLREALLMQGKDGRDVTIYEHAFEQNQLALKIAFELEAAKMRKGKT